MSKSTALQDLPVHPAVLRDLANSRLAHQIDLEIHAMFKTTAMPSFNIVKNYKSWAYALTSLIINQALPNSFLIKEEIKNGVVYSAFAINKCGLK